MTLPLDEDVIERIVRPARKLLSMSPSKRAKTDGTVIETFLISPTDALHDPSPDQGSDVEEG